MLSALLAAIAVVLVWRIIPASTVRSEGRFDIVGAIGLGAGFADVLLGVSKGSSWGWSSPATLLCALGGAAILVF